MQGDEGQVDELDADERGDHAAEAPNQQVAAKQGVGPDGTILHALQGDGDQQRDDDRVEDHGREDRRGGRVQVHDVQRLEPGQRGGEQGRHDGKILGQVVGDGKRGQRTAGHEQLLADLDHLDQLRGVAVEIDHVAGFLGGLRARVHRHADVGLGQRRGVVRAVAHHGHQLAALLLLADIGELGLGRGLGDVVVHAGLLGNGLGRERVVAGDHHGSQAHAAEPFKSFGDARLEDVFQHDHAGNAIPFADQQRRRAFAGDAGNRGLGVLGHIAFWLRT